MPGDYCGRYIGCIVWDGLVISALAGWGGPYSYSGPLVYGAAIARRAPKLYGSEHMYLWSDYASWFSVKNCGM